ncbi:deoxyuridine 5'-triphosphate nucleotidohydrolase-like [Hydra vulgaris]|uniref:Deoxyuridine 5'-triphosphate nucleotidohydrolase n=1 Tax=Hydra vulgaris TaxID=6087 RepID=A0ABM4CLD5_HYDVU
MSVLIEDLENHSFYATSGSAVLDLRSKQEVILEPFEKKLVSTGVSIFKMDNHIQGFITAKSGLALKYGLVVFNSPAVIDSDYTREIKVMLFNNSKEPYKIEKKSFIGQITFVPFVRAQKVEVEFEGCQSLFHVVSAVIENKRVGGFGSTGQ